MKLANWKTARFAGERGAIDDMGDEHREALVMVRGYVVRVELWGGWEGTLREWVSIATIAGVTVIAGGTDAITAKEDWCREFEEYLARRRDS